MKAEAWPPFSWIASTRPRSGTMRQVVLWPGVLPSWPTTGVPSQSNSISPRPQAAGYRSPSRGSATCGRHISSKVPAGTTRVPSAATPSASSIRPNRTRSRGAALGVDPAGAFDCGSSRQGDTRGGSPTCPTAARNMIASSG